MSAEFNLHMLIASLEVTRAARGGSWRSIAKEADISASTLSRMFQSGKHPDLNTFAKIVSWLKIPADTFFTDITPPTGKRSFLTEFSSLLQKTGELSEEDGQFLEELVRRTYKHLKG